MFFKQWLHSSSVRSSLIVVVLYGIMLVDAQSTSPLKAAATSMFIKQSLSQLSAPQNTKNQSVQQLDTSIAHPQGYAEHTCDINHVAVKPFWIYVTCEQPAPGGITIFFVPTSDKGHSQRALSLMLTAQAAGKPVFIGYDPDTPNSGDARQLLDILMLNHPIR